MHPRAAALLAGLVLLSGCAGSFGALSSGTGTVNVYLSDETGSIDDFEHLNVTITQVGFKRPCGGCDRNRTRDGGHHGDGDGGHHGGKDGKQAMHPMDGDSRSDRWVVVDVDSQTVDLTRFRGKNATQLRTANVPAGTYKKVFIYVSDVNATLKSGEQVDVNLPGTHLKIEDRFTVEQGGSVSFVFDVTVFQRGNQTYVLKPVASQSGTDVSFCHRGHAKNNSGDCDCNCSGGRRRAGSA